MTEQDKRARFFAKTGRLATFETVEYQAFLWGMEFGAETEREECAKLLEAEADDWERYMATAEAKEVEDENENEMVMSQARLDELREAANSIRKRSNAEMTGAVRVDCPVIGLTGD